MIALGITMAFYGLALLVPILFFTSSISGFVISLLFLNQIIVSVNTGTFMFWMIIIFSMMIGLALGYWIMFMPRYGFFLLGVFCGVA
jgi:hypothetical protein